MTERAEPDAHPEANGGQSGAGEMERAHVRGSALLLVGRVMSLALTVATQVVIVRALSKADYGVFAYAVTLTSSTRILLSLGQNQMLSRFLSSYEEENDYPRLVGSIAMAVLTIVIASTLLLGSLVVFAEPVLDALFHEPHSVEVLLVLMFLAPLEALDQVFVSLFAAFSHPRAIFFRKYLVTPGLRLTTVLAIVVLSSDVTHLAIGYVASGVIGLVLYAVLLVRLLRERGLTAYFRPRRIILPVRTVLAFSVPTLASELVVIATSTGSVMILGAYWGAIQVAGYRAVFPAARLVQLPFQTFSTLFLPMAARFHTRGNFKGLRDSYYHTALLLAVFTFPVLAMTTVFAEQTTVALFGTRYAEDSAVLAILAWGYYFSVALGYNAYLLQVYAKLRYLLVSNLVVGVVSLALSLALIPQYGAVGAAAANSITLVGQNVANQVVLTRVLPRGTGAVATVRSCLVLIAAIAGLTALEAEWDPAVPWALAAVAVTSLVVLRLTRSSLHLDNHFPELTRLPVVGRLFGPPAHSQSPT